MSTRALPRPAGPKGKPFLGVFPEFRRDPPNFLLRLAQDYGDLVYFKLGPQHMYLLNRPEYVQDVLVTRNGNFRKSRILQRSKILIGEGLLTSEGEFHLRQRRLAQPAFHRERIAGYGAAMVELAARASSRWRDGEIRDIHEEMSRLALAIAGATLFSADVESEADEIGRALTDILGLFQLMLIPFSDLLLKLPVPSTRRFERARERLDATVYRLIADRRRSGADHGDFLSMLLLAQDDQEDGGGMTDRQVRDEALTILLAGHETTANALTWTWCLLSQHPEVADRFQAELKSVLNGRPPEVDDLPKLDYIEAVFAEAMRLYPPAWALGRLARNDFELASHTIPAGSICILSPYVMHRTEAWWPQPDRFDPQRWTKAARESRPKFSYFPFGGGPRVCIGERFAWMEGILLLAAIGQHWRLTLVPDQKVEPRATMTLRPRYGMRMRLTSRR